MTVGMDDLPDAPDVVRPLVLGYVQAHLLMTGPELAALKQDLQSHADREGYQLGMVFLECIDHAPAAFGALLEAIERERAEAIVIPSIRHLLPLGVPPKLVYYLRTVTGVRVLLADDPP